MVKFSMAINRHLRASVAGFDIANTILRQELIRIFKLGLVVIDIADGLVMTDNFNAVFATILSHRLHVKIRCRLHELIIHAVL